MAEPSEFKSVFQGNNSIEEEEALEQKQIQENIDRELAELSEPEFDDEEEESVVQPSPHEQQEFHLGTTAGVTGSVQPRNVQHFSHLQEFRPYQESTPLQSRLTPKNYGQNLQSHQDAILNAREGEQNIEILFEARGAQIRELQRHIEELSVQKDNEIRHLKHKNTLLDAEAEKLKQHQEYHQTVATSQSEENQILRRELDEAKANLLDKEKTIEALNYDKEESTRVIQQLQVELQTLQKSDTILRQKTQHEATLSSLKEHHSREIFELQQEIDRLNANDKMKEKEVDSLNERIRRKGKDMDNLVLEKSEIIKNLNEKLEMAQRKLTNYVTESSAQGYTNVKAMNERYQRDREKYAEDLMSNEEEIKRLRISLRTKNEEIQTKESEKLQIKNNFQQLLQEKDLMIENLNRNLHESELKITQLTRESLTGSTNAAVRRLQDELEKLKNQLDIKNEEIVTLKSSLDESLEKHKNLKIKVRLYKQEKEAQLERKKQKISEMEEDYKNQRQKDREKIMTLKANYEDFIVNELEGVQKHVDEQMKIRRLQPPPPIQKHRIDLSTGNGNIDLTGNRDVLRTATGIPLLPQPTGNGYVQITETGNAPGVGTGSDGENQSTDHLTRLLQSAKMTTKEELEQKLKRPSSAVSERSPLGEIGTNHFH